MSHSNPSKAKTFSLLLMLPSNGLKLFAPHPLPVSVIEELRLLFARFGLPEIVVTDNGTCFVSTEFEKFLKGNVVKHTTSVPYHPASNVVAETAVQMVKHGLKKVKEGSTSFIVAKVLLTSCHTTEYYRTNSS